MAKKKANVKKPRPQVNFRLAPQDRKILERFAEAKGWTFTRCVVYLLRNFAA